MKAKFNEASKLTVFIIGTLCIVGMIALVLLALAGMINTGWFIFLMLFDAFIMTLVSVYIEEHFVNGEWV